MRKLNIICLSNQPFSMPLKTNKWHVMTRLARRGHNVLFIDPPTRFKAIKALLKKELSFSRFVRGFTQENQNLTIYSPVHLFNFKPFSSLNTAFHLGRLNKILAGFEKNPTILWIYHFDYPDLENLIKELKFDMLIYDCVDEYTAFPEYSRKSTTNSGLVAIIEGLDDTLKIKLNQGGLSGKDWVIKRENWLVSNSDMVFASAPGLVNKFTTVFEAHHKRAEDLHFLPNAADFNKFKDVKTLREKVPMDLDRIPRPRILSVGALDTYKMNLPLIELSARTYPNYSFVLIGKEVEDKEGALQALKGLPNVYLLGLKQWEETPYYLASSDVYIIPYNLNEYTIGGCFPVKFHEALSAGLPTVVTSLPAYKPFKDVCYIAISDHDFVDKLKIALEEDSEARFKARQAVARENTWDGKVDKQLNLIEEKLKQKNL